MSDAPFVDVGVTFTAETEFSTVTLYASVADANDGFSVPEEMLNALAQTLSDQGRFGEAEQLTRIAINIYRELKFAPDSANAYTATIVGTM